MVRAVQGYCVARVSSCLSAHASTTPTELCVCGAGSRSSCTHMATSSFVITSQRPSLFRIRCRNPGVRGVSGVVKRGRSP